MLIHRMTFLVKNGCMDEAVHLVKEENERQAMGGRVMTGEFGPLDQLIYEVPFVSQAAMEERWDKWFGSPEADAFFQQFDPMWSGTGKNEVWNTVEPDVVLDRGEPAHLVNRRSVSVKVGKRGALVDLLKEQQNRDERLTNFRILTGAVGPYNHLMVDLEFSSYEDYFKSFEEWTKRADTQAFFEVWDQLVEPGITNEMWLLR